MTPQLERRDLDLEAEREVDLSAACARLAARWYLPLAGLLVGAILGVLLSVSGGQVWRAETLVYLGQPFTPAGGGAIPNSIATNKNADTSGYSALQKKSAEVIKNAKHITQFLDRDTDPGFASEAATNGLIAFIKNPDDIDTVLKGMADQAKNIFK